MTDVGVRGTEQLVRLAANLKAAEPELKKQLLREIRAAGKPVAQDMKAGLRATFPNAGGFASRAARVPIGIRTRMTGKQAGVRLQTSGKKATVTTRTLMSKDESGDYRHRLYGNKKVWIAQTYSPAEGWFTEPAEEAKPEVQAKVLDAMQSVARQITQGV